ncbi:hypothetical protein ACLB2K_019341 [Fragaria x ananassa]
MAFSAATSSQPCCKLCSVRFNGRKSRVACSISARRRGASLRISKAVLNDSKSSVSGNGASEPARILLERLFAQTQKLEEQMSRNSLHPLGFNLETLECDLQAVLAALKQKEEDLQDAERLVFLEHFELIRTKEGLEQREREAAAACSRYEMIEEELRRANKDLTSQASYIEDIKLQLQERDQEVAGTQSALSLKEEELEKMSEEAVKTDSELRSMAQLLNEANDVVKRQDAEILGLRRAILEKEEELEVSRTQRKLEEEKLKVSQENLEKQTMEWLLAQEELKKLAAEVSRHAGEANETLEDFRRVKNLLIDVKSELVSSQKALASSRQKMEERELLQENQFEEHEDQKRSIMSYLTTLKDAHIEVESERAKLRVAEARNKELERELSMEKELMEELE